MKKKQFKQVSVMIATLMGAAFLSASCVDNDYDLTEDIDLTIQVGGSDFAIPGGETEAIKLSKLLEVEEGDLVKIDDDGNYYLLQEGTSKRTTVTVDNFEIDEPEITPQSRSLQFSPASVGRTWTATLPTGPDAITLDYELRNREAVPQEIKTLSRIDLDMFVNVLLSYEEGIARRFTFDELTIDLPDYLTAAEPLEAGNVKRLTNVTVLNGRTYQITIPIVSIDLTNLPQGEGLDADNQAFYLTGDVVVNGRVHVADSDWFSTVGSSVIPAGLTVDASVTDIRIDIIKGQVDPEIDITVDPLELNDLPDFLTDEEVQLDMTNPQIHLYTNNQTPVTAIISGESNLASVYTNGEAGQKVMLPELQVTRLANTEFCLSPIKPEGFTGVYEEMAALPTLIEKIPQQIEVNLFAAAAPEETEIGLGRDYFIDTDYSINVPFVFGPNLTVVYHETMDGWQSDLEDYDVTQVNATGTVENKIPLDLTLTATPITTGRDENGEAPALEGITAVVKVPSQGDNNLIKANSTTDIVIEIVEEVPGQVKQLDGLVLRVEAKSGQTVSEDARFLNANQTLQLRNVRLKVPGGVNIDLN